MLRDPQCLTRGTAHNPSNSDSRRNSFGEVLGQGGKIIVKFTILEKRSFENDLAAC